MNQRIIELPTEYFDRMEDELCRRGYSLKQPSKLAQAILRLSDFYTSRPDAVSPWHEEWAQAASIAYYFPLNYARSRAVAMEAQRLGFFSGLDDLADVGSGMGAALLAFSDANSFHHVAAIDTDRSSLALGQALAGPRARQHGPQNYAVETISINDKVPAKLLANKQNLLLLMSYVFTELSHPPQWWFEAEGLAIIEPSISQDARRLMELRQSLIDQGYSVWAPCTHQEACPMLLHSKKDWCHDRIHFQGPPYWELLERLLPMKNKTLTFSYVLARKTKRAPRELAGLARLTGDMLIEKGKTRQSMCRNEQREFLSWFPQRLKKTETITLERGSLISLRSPVEVKSDEIRLVDPQAITEFLSDQEITG